MPEHFTKRSFNLGDTNWNFFQVLGSPGCRQPLQTKSTCVFEVGPSVMTDLNEHSLTPPPPQPSPGVMTDFGNIHLLTPPPPPPIFDTIAVWIVNGGLKIRKETFRTRKKKGRKKKEKKETQKKHVPSCKQGLMMKLTTTKRKQCIDNNVFEVSLPSVAPISAHLD